MYKKIIFAFVCFGFMNQVLLAAENTEICQAAKDSMALVFKRGDLAFYAPSKMNPNLYNYIVINKNYYKKTTVRLAPSSKDSSKLSKSKSLSEAYEKSADKSQPLDTSSEYKRCYNKAFQPKLDSVFKCDFFRKTDSILNMYDKAGKGYSGVEFPGGPGALQKYFDKTITIPKNVKPNDSDKAYRVYYSFFVDEKGAISEIKLAKSNCKDCEEIVLEAIKNLPPLNPARDAGKPKKVKYIMPYVKAYVKPKE